MKSVLIKVILLYIKSHSIFSRVIPTGGEGGSPLSGLFPPEILEMNCPPNSFAEDFQIFRGIHHPFL